MFKLSYKPSTGPWPLTAQTSQGELVFSGSFSQGRINNSRLVTNLKILGNVAFAFIAILGACSLVLAATSPDPLLQARTPASPSWALLVFYASVLCTIYWVAHIFHGRVSAKSRNILSWVQHNHSSSISDVFNFFTPAAKARWNQALAVSVQHGSRQVAATDILFALLQDPDVNLFFRRFDGNATDIKIFLLNYMALETPAPNEQEHIARIPFTALALAVQHNLPAIEPLVLLSAAAISLPEDHILHSIFANLNITDITLTETITWILSVKHLKKSVVLLRSKFHPTAWINTRGLLPTPLLNRYGTNLSQAALDGTLTPALGRSSDVAAISSRLEQNMGVLLIGNPGSGKMAIVHELAYAQASGKVPLYLLNRRLIQINLEYVLHDVKNSNHLWQRLLQEAHDTGNSILVLPNFHRLALDQKAAALLNTFIDFTKRYHVPYIASTTPEGLDAIRQTADFRMEKESYVLTTASPTQVFLNIALQATILEVHMKVFFLTPSLKTALALTNQYTPAIAQPQASVKVLAEAARSALHNGHAALPSTPHGRKIITEHHILKTVSSLFHIPIGQLQNSRVEAEQLELALAKTVVGQANALAYITQTLKRAQSGLTHSKLIGSFLFVGPMGTGKTEIAKALAQTYLGNSEYLLRTDAKSLNGNTKQFQKQLSQHQEKNPFTLLLIENFEDASPELCLLVTGLIKTGAGPGGPASKTSHPRILLIASTTTGSKTIQEGLQAHRTYEQIKVDLLKQGLLEHCPPELLGAFDGFVIFSPLSPTEIEKITYLQLQSLIAKLQKKKLHAHFTPELVRFIANKAYSPELGARLVHRYIEENVENLAADVLLKKKTSGYEFTFNVKNNKIVLT